MTLSSRLLLLLLLSAALCAQAQFPGEEWVRLTGAEAKEAGWSRKKLKAAREFAATLDTEAVMIVTGGGILDAWGATDEKFNVHSIRKSFLSALYGIQVAKGNIDLTATLLDLRINDNEPRLTEVEREATVLQLLQSRSGIYHPALYETAAMKAQRPLRHSHAPGTFWYYNNWDFNALGTIYEKAAGRGIHEEFQQRIADPIGMQDYVAEEDGQYITGPDSIHRAYPFRMTARDMARFGVLFLNEGKWEDRQIVPRKWVRDSVTSWSSARSSGGYGYLWWTAKEGLHFPGVTLPDGSYSARGAGGHFILVVPELDLVVVHRVNTDVGGRDVSSAQFGELLQHILAAHTDG